MNMRDDALVKASDLIKYVYEEAGKYDGLVATVGKLDVKPNLFSIIPGQVDLTLQIRDLDTNNLIKFASDVSTRFGLDYNVEYVSVPALCDKGVMNTIEESVGDLKCITMQVEHLMMLRTLQNGQWE